MFFPLHGAKCAPQTVWFERRERRVMDVEEGAVEKQKVEVLRRAHRAPARGTESDPDGARGANHRPQRGAGLTAADHGHRTRSLRRTAAADIESARARAEARHRCALSVGPGGPAGHSRRRVAGGNDKKAWQAFRAVIKPALRTSRAGD